MIVNYYYNNPPVFCMSNQSFRSLRSHTHSIDIQKQPVSLQSRAGFGDLKLFQPKVCLKHIFFIQSLIINIQILGCILGVLSGEAKVKSEDNQANEYK